MQTPTLTIGNTAIELILGDITRLEVDAVVNAANTELAGGGGVDGAIHRAAGPALADECRKIVAERGNLPTGEAVATSGGQMPARYVIHTVGPVYFLGPHKAEPLLRSAYRSSLAVAEQLAAESVAFPAISTGVYGYPMDKAAFVALRAVVDYLREHPQTLLRRIVFALHDPVAFALHRKALEMLS
ncbi:MAG: O-acetyl-ADP-ribose deacetylase [Capsulimonadaceae bacterium]|nr:O-acetyl-ADP-ribose deacetylase [Capsulimonadaceae bacterium]